MLNLILNNYIHWFYNSPRKLCVRAVVALLILMKYSQRTLHWGTVRNTDDCVRCISGEDVVMKIVRKSSSIQVRKIILQKLYSFNNSSVQSQGDETKARMIFGEYHPVDPLTKWSIVSDCIYRFHDRFLKQR